MGQRPEKDTKTPKRTSETLLRPLKHIFEIQGPSCSFPNVAVDSHFFIQNKEILTAKQQYYKLDKMDACVKNNSEKVA